ncbi:MAG: helix-turn-helix domain-containing protein [Bacilli bacterium]
MSVNATRFAWECDLSKTTKRSAKRLVLLALADRANKENTCFPSIARVVKDTGMDRKTVMNTINDLITIGLVSDTGERKGGTNQVRVLKINVVKQESYPQSCDNSSNKQCEISKETVVNLPINGVKFPSNGGKFGTQNLKESLIKSKNNLKGEKDFNLDEEIVLKATQQDSIEVGEIIVEDVPNSLKTAHNSSNVEVGGTYIPEQDKTSNTSLYSDIQQPKKQWIPRDQYAKHMKQKRLDDQLNKEPFIPKSMIKGWEDGMKGNPNATKGIPEHLLNNPSLAKILRMKRKHTDNNV